MRATKRVPIIGAVGCCLLTVPVVRLAWQPRPQISLSRPPARPAEPRSPSAEALSRARRHRMQAQNAVKREREAQLEAASPEAAEAMDTEEWRRLLAVRDPGGHLGRARAAALDAVALARSLEEERQARFCLVLIECDAGRHHEELRHAWRLMTLAPRNEHSLLALRRAEACRSVRALPR